MTAKPFARQLRRVRRVCLSLPGATEKLSHGEPTFFVHKRVFAGFSNNHHGDGHVAVVLPASPGLQEALIEEAPHAYYRPPYVGGAGWIGVRLDTGLDWNIVASLIKDAYRKTAPPRLRRQLEESTRKRFKAALIDGHKGFAFEVPFDPGRKEISGMLNGVPFDSVVALLVVALCAAILPARVAALADSAAALRQE